MSLHEIYMNSTFVWSVRCVIGEIKWMSMHAQCVTQNECIEKKTKLNAYKLSFAHDHFDVKTHILIEKIVLKLCTDEHIGFEIGCEGSDLDRFSQRRMRSIRILFCLTMHIKIALMRTRDMCHEATKCINEKGKRMCEHSIHQTFTTFMHQMHFNWKSKRVA